MIRDAIFLSPRSENLKEKEKKNQKYKNKRELKVIVSRSGWSKQISVPSLRNTLHPFVFLRFPDGCRS